MDEQHISHNWSSFERYRAKNHRGLLTGYPRIDKKIVGLAGLVTVMGEPKCCKSTFVLGIALENAKKGIPVIYFDKENGIERTRLRMICYLSGLTFGAVKGKLYSNEEEYYKQAVESLHSYPIYYKSTSETVESLEESIKILGKQTQKPVLLIVDSLQSIITDFKDRRASVDYWVFAFNDLKNKYNEWLTTLLVSEKNRHSYGMSNRAGAKESGGIEYKAEQVFDLYTDEKTGHVLVNCVFNRDGDTGLVAELIQPNPYTYKLAEVEYCPEE